MWLLAGRCVLGLEDLPSDRGTGLLGLGPDQHPRPLAPASVASSAVMSTAIMATLLLFKHQKVGPGVLRAQGGSPALGSVPLCPPRACSCRSSWGSSPG